MSSLLGDVHQDELPERVQTIRGHGEDVVRVHRKEPRLVGRQHHRGRAPRRQAEGVLRRQVGLWLVVPCDELGVVSMEVNRLT